MALPSSGAISLGAVNTELGVSATAARSLNDSTTRTLFGVASGAISLSNGYGKANQFAFTVSANQTNANLRTLAVNAGWNQSSKVIATVNSGVVIYSTSTGTPALTINGSFPGGVELVNSGVILGAGGAGGRGGACYTDGTPGAGAGGGLGLSVSVAVSINNVNRIAGGGGGGGGGEGYFESFKGGSNNVSGGGGGGGIGNGAGGAQYFGSPINSRGLAGGAGTLTAAGSGGSTAAPAGNGGSGGSYGAAGSAGSNSPSNCSPGAGGGAAGGAVSGNGNITWIAFGTRNGGIS